MEEKYSNYHLNSTDRTWNGGNVARPLDLNHTSWERKEGTWRWSGKCSSVQKLTEIARCRTSRIERITWKRKEG